ncbi:CdaR family protein [Aquimarina rhabdastrellae]
MGIRNRIAIKKDNIKTFLFFLGFTSLLWLFIQFSKKYTREVVINITYTNIPEQKTLDKNSDLTLKLTLNGNGFRLLRYMWKSPTLTFNMNDAKMQNENSYYFDLMNVKWKEKLKYNGEIIALDKENLNVSFYQNLKKKIPLVSRQYITYAPGFGSAEGLKIEPDSVWITGPKTMVDTIHNLKLNPVELRGLNADFYEEIGIEQTSLPTEVKIEPEKIQGTIAVSKFTEGNIEVPVNLINSNIDGEIRIFPKKVKLIYKISLEDYSEIVFTDFKIIADYQKANTDLGTLPLTLVKKPDHVKDVRLQEEQVQFIILK